VCGRKTAIHNHWKKRKKAKKNSGEIKEQHCFLIIKIDNLGYV
jgi:hypothetical protein